VGPVELTVKGPFLPKGVREPELTMKGVAYCSVIGGQACRVEGEKNVGRATVLTGINAAEWEP